MKKYAPLIIVAIALFLSTFAATPAFAVASDATPTAEVLYPLHTRVDGQIRIVIQGPRYTHGLRAFAREADAQLPGVTIYPHSTCKAHPRAECVKYSARHYGANKNWYAQTVMIDPTRMIMVNLDLPNDHMHAVVTHEFGHVLGLGHHADPDGVCGGVSNITHLSQGELDALNAAYPITSGGLD